MSKKYISGYRVEVKQAGRQAGWREGVRSERDVETKKILSWGVVTLGGIMVVLVGVVVSMVVIVDCGKQG